MEAGGGGGGGGEVILRDDGSEGKRGTAPTRGGGGRDEVLLTIDTNRSRTPSRDTSLESINNTGFTMPNGTSNGTSTSTTALAHTHSKDQRPERLALIGLALSALALLLSIVAVSTSQWSRIEGLAGGFLGPFLSCQDSYRGYSECSPHSWPNNGRAAITGGACAALSCVLAAATVLLSGAIVAMHRSENRVLLKFRHATTVRMVVVATAGFLSFVSVVSFLVEVFLVRGATLAGLSLTWGFYMELLAMLVLWVAGGSSSAEWQRSRKLGGDPTMSNRDPQGLNAHTISNPHFKEDPPAKQASSASRSTSPTNRSMSPTVKGVSTNHRSTSPIVRGSSPNSRGMSPNSRRPSSRSASPSGGKKTTLMSPMEVHRNTNGVAMTHISGQPYVLSGANGHVANGRPGSQRTDTNIKISANSKTSNGSKSSGGKPSGGRSVMGRGSSSKSPKNGRRGSSGNGGVPFVAFDPSRTPLRSSLRKPKQNQQLEGTAPSSGDNTDGTTEGGIPNPAFAQSSPLPKKKVRIHTQSTAV